MSFLRKKDDPKYLPRLNPVSDVPEEHRVSLPGIEIAIVHSLQTVFMVDQTGATQEALLDLEAWCKTQGYFLHCVSVKPLPRQPDKLNVKEQP